MQPLEPSISSKFFTKTEVAHLSSQLKNQGKKVVFTNGCFDILHAGHVQYLAQAKACGDFLVLGLNSDASVQKLKGPTRPLNSQEERGLVLAGLSAIDAVVIFDDLTPIPLLEAIQPNIHAKGGDYQAESLPEYSTIKSYGGEVIIIPFRPGCSTTELINKILTT